MLELKTLEYHATTLYMPAVTTIYLFEISDQDLKFPNHFKNQDSIYDCDKIESNSSSTLLTIVRVTEYEQWSASHGQRCEELLL